MQLLKKVTHVRESQRGRPRKLKHEVKDISSETHRNVMLSYVSLDVSYVFPSSAISETVGGIR